MAEPAQPDPGDQSPGWTSTPPEPIPPGPAEPEPAQPGRAAERHPTGPIRPDQALPTLPPFDWEGRLAAASRGPMSWGFLAFFLGFGAYYLASLVIAAVVTGTSVGLDAIPPRQRGPLLLLLLLPNVLLGVAPAVLSWWRGQGLRRDYGIVPTRRDLWVGLSCGGTALFAGLVINVLLQRLVYRGAQPTNVLRELDRLTDGRSVWLALTALFLVLGAPLTEELLVRGALWGALEHYRVNRYAILAMTALVFAFMHQEPTLTLALFCQGLAIGAARMMTGRIGASMIAHATNNLIPALVLVLVG